MGRQSVSALPKGSRERDGAALDFPDANLLAVSRSGEVAAAVLSGRRARRDDVGTLAQAPLDGGAPRELENDVLFADWSPDGKDLAVARLINGKAVLEYPTGKKVYETDGLVTYPRISPDGELIAFLDHPTRSDKRGTLAVVDRSGARRVLSRDWAGAEGLAWHPRGKEIWIGATEEREARAV